MADTVEKTGKSVDEAILLALEELRCDRDDAEVEILAAPAKGLWGILGTKEARVRVSRKTESAADTEPSAASAGTEGGRETSPAGDTSSGAGLSPLSSETESSRMEGVPPDKDDQTAAFLRRVTGFMGIEAEIGRSENEDAIHYTLNGPRMGALIGRRGETLDAIQYLSNIIAGREKGYARKRIIVDAEDYRRRREDTLIRLATRLAAKAKKSGRRVVLEPMNPQERRVIHTTLEKDPDVKSLSEGEEPYRRLVIYPTGSEGRGGGDYRAGRYGRDRDGDRGGDRGSGGYRNSGGDRNRFEHRDSDRSNRSDDGYRESFEDRDTDSDRDSFERSDSDRNSGDGYSGSRSDRHNVRVWGGSFGSLGNDGDDGDESGGGSDE